MPESETATCPSTSAAGSHAGRASVAIASLAVVTFVLLTFAAPARATFPGVNGLIAYQSENGTDGGIYLMGPDGSGQEPLITGTWSFPGHVSWSPDGTRLLFTMSDEGEFDRNIFVVRADGSDLVRLTDAAGDNQYPDWSPDGSQIVFQSDRDGDDELFTMNADGSGQTQITNNDYADSRPRWAPDSSRIAFTSLSTGVAHIYLIDPDGANLTPLTSGPSQNSSPDWSPDSARLVFTGYGTDDYDDVYTMARDGSDVQQLTDTDGTNEGYPVWSPDGTMIAFERSLASNNQIFRMRSSDGGGELQLIDSEFGGYEPSWQPVQPEPPASSTTSSTSSSTTTTVTRVATATSPRFTG